MSEPPRDDKADEPTGSAPWERPRRWNDPRLDATRVDDLLARLGNEDEQSGRRHRKGSNKVAASDLIAALQASESTSPDTTSTDTAASTRPTEAAAANVDQQQATAAGEDLTETIRRPLALDPSAHITPPAAIDPDATAIRAIGLPVTPSSLPRSPLVTPLPSSLPPLTAPPPLSPTAGPGVVWAPGVDDNITEQIPKFGPSEDIGSIRESLLRQHSGGNSGADRDNATPAGASIPPVAQRRKHRGLMVAGRSVIAIVSALLLVYVGFQWNLVERTNKALDNSSGHGAYLHPTDPHISPPSTVTATGTTPGTSAPAPAIPAAVHYQPENILLLGSDTRAGANGNAGNDNGQESTAQSDTVMVAHISADRQHVTILSIPRDLKINAPTCKEVNQTTGALTTKTYPVTPGTKWHFTNAFSVGGPACTDIAVQELTGLQITRILGIDFQGFKTMVDALHGVTVNVCRPIRDKTLGLVVAAGGVQTIGGDQALSLVRAREVAGDPSGDIGRIHRQQIVLSAMLRQVTTAGVLLNPAKLSSFLDAFVKATAFNDNITVEALVQLSHEFGDLAPGKVTFYTLPTHTDGDFQVVDSTGPAIFAALRNDQLLPGQKTVPPSSTAAPTGLHPVASSRTRTATGTVPATSTPATTTAPQTISVNPAGIDLQIDNLTGTAGVSSKVADTLNGYGFRVGAADLVRPKNTQGGITVQYSAGNRDAATVVAAAVPGSTLTLTPALGKKVKLMLGTSYHGSLTKVAVGQTLPSRLQTTPSSTSSSSTASSSSSSPTSPTSAAPHTSTVQKTAPGVKSSDIASVNAAQTDCA